VKKIPVIGDSCVVIAAGLLEEVPARLLEAGLKPAAWVVVSDDTVFQHYGERLLKAFEAAGIQREPEGDGPKVMSIAFKAGEKSKTRKTKEEVEDFMLANKCTRSTVVVALGGGVVGDLSGYVAATYMRGVPVVQIPTSTMSIIDSSVGGKTAINVPAGKNLIGAFHQPRFVFADPLMLKTLSRREVAEGLAEAIKMGVIRDVELFEMLKKDPERALSLDPCLLRDILYKAVKHKADVVAIDEKETGLRATLNYGHTIGHAIEALVSPELLHGECVSIGCVWEAELASRMGHLEKEAVAKIRNCLEAYGLPVTAPKGLSTSALMQKMAVDKKNEGKTIRCTIITGIGTSIDHPLPVSRDIMEAVVQDMVDAATLKLNLPCQYTENQSECC